MCKYCEEQKRLEERENDNIHFEIYGRHLRVIGKLPMISTYFGRDVLINYCPMCRQKVRWFK